MGRKSREKRLRREMREKCGGDPLGFVDGEGNIHGFLPEGHPNTPKLLARLLRMSANIRANGFPPGVDVIIEGPA